tara:strand:- start:551 stop:676 length:126 start_codon:yes stop_codon:yes gene_type:complete
MNIILKGIIGIVKLVIVLYAFFYAIESGLLKETIELFGEVK